MKDRHRKILLFCSVFLGLAVLNYPFLSQLFNMHSQSTVIQTYRQQVDSLSEDRKEQILEEAESYNRDLAETSQSGIRDAFSDAGEMSSRYENLLNLDESGVMGFLRIPSIHVTLPVYHGTSARVLEAGAGHLEGSSLPVGGESTHAVISAHNGLPSKLLFTDLDRLEEGDRFFLNVAGRELAYEVEQIRTVEPEETEELQIVKDADYVTLLTCTPYGVNSHRYLVRGGRIPWDGEEAESSREVQGKWQTGNTVFLVSLALLVLSAALLFLPRKKR